MRLSDLSTGGRRDREGRHRASYPPSSMLERREHFHLAYRAVSRLLTLSTAAADTSPSSRRRARVAVASLVGDVVGAVVLRRSDRFLLVPRLACDALETAVSSRGETGLELATLPGVPLTIEAALRLGWGGLVVPAVNALVTGAVRVGAGRRPAWGAFRYQVMGVVVGRAIRAYENNQRDVALARHRQDLDARRAEAGLAGQHAVATGADTVVDLLVRTTPLLGTDSSRPSRDHGRSLADWRQALADGLPAHAVYLGMAARQWQHRHNAAHPTLADDVELTLPPGHGTVLLTPTQVTILGDVLDALELPGGTHELAVVDVDGARQPNRPRVLSVGDHVVTVPADPQPGLAPFDIVPLGFIPASLWMADTVVFDNGGCDPRAIAPAVVAGPLLALWSHRRVVRRGPAAHVAVLCAAVGQAAYHTVASTLTLSNLTNSEGIQRFPFLDGLHSLLMATAVYWDSLTANQRAAMVTAVGALVVLGIVLEPKPIRWTHLALEVLWPVSSCYALAGLRTGSKLEAAARTESLRPADDAALARAFESGRATVIDLVTATRDAAWDEFWAMEDGLDPRIRDEAMARLEEVDRRLAALSAAPPAALARGAEGSAVEGSAP